MCTQGKSLLTPCPRLPPSPSPSSSPRPSSFRSTLFAHVSLPSPLPQSLCETDVEQFKDLNTWEEHLRQTEPWLEKQKVSETASLIWGVEGGGVGGRRRSRGRGDSPPATNGQLLEGCAMTDPAKLVLSSKDQRGATFVSLPASRKASLSKGARSVHNPNNKRVVTGLGVLLSYLIEEPPDVYVKNQSWDIFSVPGDKTKVRRPVTEKERAKSAGDSIVRAEVVSEFLESLYKICKWTSECHIIAFILMVRTVHMSEGKVRGATRESIARRNSMRAQHIPE